MADGPSPCTETCVVLATSIPCGVLLLSVLTFLIIRHTRTRQRDSVGSLESTLGKNYQPRSASAMIMNHIFAEIVGNGVDGKGGVEVDARLPLEEQPGLRREEEQVHRQERAYRPSSRLDWFRLSWSREQETKSEHELAQTPTTQAAATRGDFEG